MRNLYHTYQCSNTVFIDFLQDEARLQDVSDQCAGMLLSAFQTRSVVDMSAGEEDVMVNFLAWFNVFKKCGLAVSAMYPRCSNSADLPANTSFTYVNCNTGAGVVFIGLLDDGAGDITFGGMRI